MTVINVLHKHGVISFHFNFINSYLGSELQLLFFSFLKERPRLRKQTGNEVHRDICQKRNECGGDIL